MKKNSVLDKVVFDFAILKFYFFNFKNKIYRNHIFFITWTPSFYWTIFKRNIYIIYYNNYIRIIKYNKSYCNIKSSTFSHFYYLFITLKNY